MSYYSKKRKSGYGFHINAGVNDQPVVYSHSFYLSPPSVMQVRVSHYGPDVVLHFANKQYYLQVKENEFYDLFSKYNDIVSHLKKCRRTIKFLAPQTRKKCNETFSQIPPSEITKSLLKKKKRKAKVEESSDENLTVDSADDSDSPISENENTGKPSTSSKSLTTTVSKAKH